MPDLLDHCRDHSRLLLGECGAGDHGAANMAAGMIRGFVVIFTVALAAITIIRRYHGHSRRLEH